MVYNYGRKCFKNYSLWIDDVRAGKIHIVVKKGLKRERYKLN